MKRCLGLLILVSICFASPAWGFSIVPGKYSLNYGSSLDRPSQNIEKALIGLDDDSRFMLVNGYSDGVAGGLESWFGTGAIGIILEEIAGYELDTTFGWYNADDRSYGQIFRGPDCPGAEAPKSYLTIL